MYFVDLQDLLLVAMIFVPLERLIPLRPRQRILRDGWATDLLHVVISGALIKIGIAALVTLPILASPLLVPSAVRATVAAQPTWLAFIEILLIADLGFYLSHRAFHKLPWLWRFHSVHHSIEEMHWLAAHRVHPLDQILTKSASLIPIFALGFSFEPMFLFAMTYRWQALLIHSNVRIGFGPLRWIFASPQFIIGITPIYGKRSTRTSSVSSRCSIFSSEPCSCRVARHRAFTAPMIRCRVTISDNLLTRLSGSAQRETATASPVQLSLTPQGRPGQHSIAPPLEMTASTTLPTV